MRGWGGVRALYLEIRLRGRALRLNQLHNTNIHASPSPLAGDQAKGMDDVSSEMGGGGSRSGGLPTTLLRERAAVGKRTGDSERMRVGREWLRMCFVLWRQVL
jgi:hypothetical protein